MKSKMPAWIGKLVRYVVLFELGYLLVINALLNVDLTQTVVNKIRPEKFQASWDRAWSWYPFRFHVRGVFANGQSRSQQWQFETPAVAGSIAGLPLILKRVRVSDVQATDVTFRLRPRLKPDRDYTPFIPHYPDIQGWEMTDAVTTPRKKKRPWHIRVTDISLSGQHDLWMHQFKGKAQLSASGGLTYVSRGGAFSLDLDSLDLQMERLFVNGDQEVLRRARVAGSLGFDPFVPREHKDLTMMEFLRADVEVDIDSNSLAFINVFLLNFPQFTVDGRGEVSGRLRLDRGTVLEGTDLKTEADALQLDILSHRIAGDGDVTLQMAPEPHGLDLKFVFADLEVIHAGDDRAMLTGSDLQLGVGGDGYVLPGREEMDRDRTISLDVGGLAVPDLSLLQRYLPEKWPMRLHGGSGESRLSALLTPGSLKIDLNVTSDEADMAIENYRFDTNLDAAIRLDNPSIMSSNTEVSGSYIRLSDAHLRKDGQRSPKAWDASLVIDKGFFSLLSDDNRQSGDDVLDLFEVLGRSEASQLLGDSTGSFEFDADVSSLAWIGVLFKQEHQTTIAGQGTVGGTMELEAGMPAPGTDIRVESQELALNFLDYRSQGDGEVRLQVSEGGDNPDWNIRVDLEQADLKRQGESEASIDQVNLALDALVEDVSLSRPPSQVTLDIDMPTARVKDMTLFNAFIPADSGLTMVGGTADLNAKIQLRRNDADGRVQLRSSALEADLDGTAIQADLAADVLIVDGVARDMFFDISGSTIRLDNVRVGGEKEDFDEEAWSALLELQKGETTWRKPFTLDVLAELTMSDSRPFVALFKNQEKMLPRLLGGMLETEDIRGNAELHMTDKRIEVPLAKATSDNIDVGLKAVIEGADRSGAVYLRYRKLDALLRFEGEDRNIDIIGPLEKFGDYQLQP